MKKIFFSILLISSVAFSQVEKKLGEFNKVTAFDKIDVTLIQGTENKIILHGPGANEVEIVNKNGELKIKMPFTKMLTGDGISATVYFTKLDAVEANEGSRIATKDAISAISFDIICKEGSEIKLFNLQADKLEVRATQGSIVTIKGNVKNQDILSNSGGKYDGQDCITEQTVVTVNAGGIASVYATDFVDAKTRAGGDITIYGNPKQINQKTVAGGSIKQAN
uniref:head GIN domain-containing protein n=1 Tax=Flavobacterium sp. TaxID=239 RepID=UPI0040494813